MSALNVLIGKAIEDITFANDYYTIQFTDGSGMHVFNYLGDFSAERNRGHSVVDVASDLDEIKLLLDNGDELVISLRDKDYVGPEVYYFSDPKSGLMIVD